MTDRPKRIQRKRTKGWKMPPNTVYVGRPTKWGNPYGRSPDDLAKYREQAIGCLPVEELRGFDLACWCKEGDPCHADVLLEIANSPAGADEGNP